MGLDDLQLGGQVLTAQDLLAGSLLVHDIAIPAAVLHPGQDETGDAAADRAERVVRLRPLKVGTLALITRAARDDAALLPLLMIKEALVAPVLTLDQARQMHAGLVQFLVAAINHISGLEGGQQAVRAASTSPVGEAHLLLARHYGWTPAQVAELTPAQMALYLAGLTAPAAGSSDTAVPGAAAQGAPW
ncbi:MAG: hypothetical protein RL722_1059 [Pseudomonadota bacterium]|jgi:hypothetical protein